MSLGLPTTRTNITHMGKQTKPHNTTTHRIRINPTNKTSLPYPETLSIYLSTHQSI